METVVITGANRGIGLELVRQFAQRGDQVIALCRCSSEALSATGARILEGIDVTSEEAVHQLTHALQDLRIDRLIHNAGVLIPDSLDALDSNSIEQQFQVNALAPLMLTAALRPRLATGSRVFIITSRMGSIADNDSGGAYGYRMSKTAVNMAAKSLSVDLAGEGIAVAVLHPGYVATDMTSHQGPVSVQESARGLIERMDELELSDTGAFRHANGEHLPW